MNRIICGDCREVLKTFPRESIDLVIYSPPYYGLRDYSEKAVTVWGGDPNCEHEWVDQRVGLVHENRNFLKGTQEEVKASGRGVTWIRKYDSSRAAYCVKCGAWRGQLGLEPDWRMYIQHLIEINREVKRVLKKTGSLYVVIGDTYAGSHCGRGDKTLFQNFRRAKVAESMYQKSSPQEKAVGYQPKCLPPDTLILGDNKEIKDINVGDVVVTKSGLDPVLEVYKRRYRGKLLVFKGEGLLPFAITPDHPILVVEGDYSDCKRLRLSAPVWKEARELKVMRRHSRGDFLLIPKINGFIEVKELDLTPYIDPRAGKPYNGCLKLPLDEETAWILGLYVAEGSKSCGNAISFAINVHEKDVLNRIISWARKYGYNFKIQSHPPSGLQVYVYSALLKRAFPDWCGNKAINKKIPEFILFNKDGKILEAFIEGYVKGDGTKIVKRNNLIISCKTASKVLALQLQLALARLGVFAHIVEVKRGGIKKLFGDKLSKQRDAYHVYWYPHGNKRKSYRILADFIAVPLRKIEERDYEGIVYNLETDDHTYLVSNAVVHNCLMGIPWRFAFAMIEDGWILRNAIIWYKCLGGNVPIYAKTGRGGIIRTRVKDLAKLKDVYLPTPDGWKRVLAIKRQPRGELITIHLRNGFRIEVTPEHKFLVGGRLIEARNLKKGMVLDHARLPDESGTPMGTYENGWITGFWLAEGSYEHNRRAIRFNMNSEEDEYMERIRKWATKYAGRFRNHDYGKSRIVVVEGEVPYAIIRHYTSRAGAKRKRLSNNAFLESNEFLRGVLDGFLAGDGYYDEKNGRWRFKVTTNYELIEDLRVVCNRLGYFMRTRLRKTKGFGKEYPCFDIEIREKRKGHFNQKDDFEIMKIEKTRGISYEISIEEPHIFILPDGTLTHNSNHMPESVKDRLTKTYEYIFHFVKSRKYYYNLDMIREPYAESTWKRSMYSDGKDLKGLRLLEHTPIKGGGNKGKPPSNILSTGFLSEFKFREMGMNAEKYGSSRAKGERKHIRDFLVGLKMVYEEMKKSSLEYESKFSKHEYGQSPQGFVRDQSLARMREASRKVAKRLFPNDPKLQQKFVNWVHDHAGDIKGKNPGDVWIINTRPLKERHYAAYPVDLVLRPILSSCPSEGIVLDPLCGSGTTLLACELINRKMWDEFRIPVNEYARKVDWRLKWIGIEIVPEYVKIAEERLKPFLTQKTLLEMLE